MKSHISGLFVAAVFLTGCGGSGSNSGGGDNGAGGSARLKQSDLVGLWDISSVYSDGSENVFYNYIDSNGFVHDFDYQNDTVDEGDNCYETGGEEPKEFYSVDDHGNVFWYVPYSANPLLYTEIRIAIEFQNGGNLMKVIAPDFWDQNQNGNYAEDTNLVSTRISNLVIEDLQPLCG